MSAVVRMAAAAGVVAALASCGDVNAAQPSTLTAGPSARPVDPDPAIGAVFLGGGPLHSCTGTVLNSARADLILTAAHCLPSGIGTTFVPGYDDDADDQNEWTVSAVYLDQRWVDNQDPKADFAIARVGHDGGGSLREEVGGGLSVGRAPKPHTIVTVTGYPMGIGGGPISCTAPTGSAPDGYPSLPCDGLTDGLSGSPWLSGSTITGIIGGLDGGGCDERVSYSPVFDGAVGALLARAEDGGPGDDPPTAFGDGC
jgi:hypothetical protein